MTTRRIKADELTPDPANANKGTERGSAMLEDSLRQLGAGRSILVDKNGVVIAGNKSLETAVSIGLDDVILVQTDGTKLVAVQRTDLDLEADLRAKRLALADNRIGQVNLDFDAEIVRALMEEDPASVEGLWREDEIAELLKLDEGPKEAPEAKLDQAEALKEKWQTATGQLWIIPSKSVPGKNHRLLCGDSTKAEDVARLMDGERAGALIADPPYGMGLDTDYSKLPSTRPEGNRVFAPIIGDSQEFDYHRVVSIEGIAEAFWFGADYYAKTIPIGGSWLVWDKRVEETFDSMFGSAFELIWSRVKHKREIIRCNNTLFSGESEARGKLHPTTKPTKVIGWIMEKYSGTGDIVYDPYHGSGTTMIAGEQEGRLVYAMELEAKYIAVALERMAGMGLEPRLSHAS